MKCYYEELGIERDANESEIKTAYRKLALKWHPDKNLNCLEEAKERFQLIQQAYEVLSDTQERAWYDNHREQILKGKNSDYEDSCLDVFQYFTVSCFKGYADDEKGFYAVYREVFQKIAAEDAEFMEDEEELANIPSFGDSKSSYEEVVGPFYAYWSAYCTKKTYAWLCPYDIREIKDRRILREIEKDMKKVAQKAKRERNEEVRNLVSFVRKRDKRMQAYKKALEERAAFNRQKQEQNRLEQIRRRQKEVEEMKRNSKANNTHNDDYEEQLKQLEQQYSSDDEYFEDEEEDEEEQEEDDAHAIYTGNIESDEENEDYIDELYCVACDKEFKTKKAFANHQTSKKHQDNIEKLKHEMQAKEKSYLNEENCNQQTDRDDRSTKLENEEEGEVENKRKHIANSSCKQGKGKNKKASKKLKKPIILHSENETDEERSVNDIARQTSQIDLPEKVGKDNNCDENGYDTDDDWNRTNKKLTKKSKNKTKANKNNISVNETQPAKKPTEVMKESITLAKSTSDLESETAQHICATCKSKFESKNKLFSHLKLTNHGVYIPKSNAANDDKKTKKSKGKRK